MWIVFIFILFGSMAVMMVGWQGWQGKLRRNPLAGIRTPYSMSSDERWKAVHHHGAPYLIFGGVATFSAALALLPFAIADVLPEMFVTAVVIAIVAVILGSVLAAWRKGISAAKAELGD